MHSLDHRVAMSSLKNTKDLNNGRRCALKRVIMEYWWVFSGRVSARGAASARLRGAGAGGRARARPAAAARAARIVRGTLLARSSPQPCPPATAATRPPPSARRTGASCTRRTWTSPCAPARHPGTCVAPRRTAWSTPVAGFCRSRRWIGSGWTLSALPIG